MTDKITDTQKKFHEASDAYIKTFVAMTTRPMASLAEYRLPNGETCVGNALLFEPNVAVQRAFMPAGSTFPLHAHAEIEWIIVYYGELQITVGDDARTLVAGRGTMFGPMVAHEMNAVTDCWMICITIPHSSGYPRG